MNAIGLIERHRKQEVLESILGQVQSYLPRDAPLRGAHDPEFLRPLAATDIFLPFDKWFSQYAEQFRIHEAARRIGFRAEGSNTVVKPWPWRFNPSSHDPKDNDKFWEVLGSSCTGVERYVEWKRG